MSDRSDDQRLYRSKTFSYDIMEDGDIRVKMDRTMSTSESPIPPRNDESAEDFIRNEQNPRQERRETFQSRVSSWTLFSTNIGNQSSEIYGQSRYAKTNLYRYTIDPQNILPYNV